MEHYGRGEDKAWGIRARHVTFAPLVPLDLRSVSKSVVGLSNGAGCPVGGVAFIVATSANFVMPFETLCTELDNQSQPAAHSSGKPALR